MMRASEHTAIAFMLMLIVSGCSTSQLPQETAVAKPGVDREVARRVAVQHVIDGSVNEAKGDHARAILDYQDALRYDKSPGIYFALSKNYSLLGKHAIAIETGREAVRLDPDNLDYRRALANAFTASYQIEEAARQYEEIIARDSSSVEAWYALARLYEARKPLRSLEIYEAFLRRFGPDWNVLFQIAGLHTKLGQHEKAADALRRMVEIDPGNQALRKGLAEAYVRTGNLDEALRVLRELHELDPDNLEYRAELAGILLTRKEYPEAMRHVDIILAQDSLALETKLLVGQYYFGQMEKDSAVAPYARLVFERIRDAHPDDWRPYWFLGGIGALTRDDSLSVRSFRRVTELARWNADGWVYLSSVFLRTSNFREMASVLEAAHRVLPEDFRVNFFLGLAYSRTGRNEDAARALETARGINPKDIDAISQLALVYDTMRQYGESDSLYEEALRIDPANHLVLNNYSYSLAERGVQLERALAMATEAVEGQPENPSYLDTIGWVYFKLGQYREAEKYILMAITKGEASAVVYEHLGDVYYRLNDVERALENWNLALKLDQSNNTLKDKIARGAL